MSSIDPTSLRLSDFFDEWFQPLQLRGRSPRTVSLYRTSLRTLTRFLARAPFVSDLTELTINRYLCWFRSLPRSPASVNKEHANMTAMWRFACRRGWLKEWPDVQRDPQPRLVPVAWMPHELDQLFDTAARLDGWIGGVPCAAWWKALLLVLWDTGERVTAIRKLEWGAIDMREGWVIVPAGQRKGGRSDEAYKLHPQTLDALKAIKLPKRPEVFPWPYTENYLWNRYDKVLEKAGLPTDRRSKFHRIRRSVGSYVKAAGGDPTETLRHSDSRTTRAYLDPRVCGPKPAVDYLFRPDDPHKKPPDDAA